MLNLSLSFRSFFIGSLFLLCSLVFNIGCGKPQKFKSEVSALFFDNNTNSSSIVGGEEVMSATDSIARVTVLIYNYSTQGKCTGSLLGNNFVLTAAHCLGNKPDDLYVFFSANIATMIQTAPQNLEKRKVVAATAYPQFKTNGSNFKDLGDIAILKYEGNTPAVYAHISFLTINNVLKEGVATTIAGYGVNNGTNLRGSGVLRKVTTTIANTSLAKTEILLEQRTGKGSCHGDSGGPAFVVINNLYYLWGVASRGSQSNDQCNQFSIYTNTFYYLQWIKETILKMR